MIDGNVNEFVDGLFRGSEWWFLFRGRKYFVQGWWKDGKATMLLADDPDDGPQVYIWEKTTDKMEENVQAFLAAPLWAGKPFWEAESEMTWVD